MTQKTIIVTGAAGFIGSGLVSKLNAEGTTSNLVLVDAIDHPAKHKNLQNKLYRELLPIQGLHKWLEGRQDEIEAVFHLGACSDTLQQNEQLLRENNTLYTQQLAEYCLRHNIRFIYASSAATYGGGQLGFSDDHALLEKLKPLNLYGLSKHWFDLWALKEGVLDQIVGLKYFNVFGPNESHKGRMASMICKMAPLIQKEGVIQLFRSTKQGLKDGDQCRDFIYVKDAVEMTYQFLHHRQGGIFNVGMGRPTTWNELAAAVFKALNKPTRIEYIEMPRTLADQYQNYTCADMKKYEQAQPLQFAYTIETAAGDYVQQHLIPNRPW